MDAGILLTNPLSRVRLEKERRRFHRVLTVREEKALLRAASSHLRIITMAALDTGMRRGELLSQLWEHVDLERRLLTVTKSKTAGGETREIPLSDRLFRLLHAREKKKGIVFTFNDSPIHRLKTGWKGALRRSNIRPLRFHDLRHTFNTRLMEAGVMQEIRKALMGHSSGEDVNSIYTHVELPTKRQAIKKLEAWYAAQRKNKRKGENENTKAVSARAVGLLQPGTGRDPGPDSAKS